MGAEPVRGPRTPHLKAWTSADGRSSPGLGLDSRIGNDVSSQMNSKINTLEPAYISCALLLSTARDSLMILSVINCRLHFSYQNAQLVIFNSKEIYPLAMNTVRNYSLNLTK